MEAEHASISNLPNNPSAVLSLQISQSCVQTAQSPPEHKTLIIAQNAALSGQASGATARALADFVRLCAAPRPDSSPERNSTFKFDSPAFSSRQPNVDFIAGIDEAGRGPVIGNFMTCIIYCRGAQLKKIMNYFSRLMNHYL